MLPRWGAGERTAQVVQESLGIDPGGARPPLPRLAHAPPRPLHQAVRPRPAHAPRSTTPARPPAPTRTTPRAGGAGARPLRRRAEARGRRRPRRGPAPRPQAAGRPLRQAPPGHAGEERRRGRAPRRQDDRRRQRRLRRADEGRRPRRAQEGRRRREAEPRGRPQARPHPGRAPPGPLRPRPQASDKTGELWALSPHRPCSTSTTARCGTCSSSASLENGDWEEARKVGESAMFIDVHNWKTHRLYARALARTGRFVSAVYELNSALVCHPKPAGPGRASTASWPRPTRSSRSRRWRKQALEYQKQIAAAPRRGLARAGRRHGARTRRDAGAGT